MIFLPPLLIILSIKQHMANQAFWLSAVSAIITCMYAHVHQHLVFKVELLEYFPSKNSIELFLYWHGILNEVNNFQNLKNSWLEELHTALFCITMQEFVCVTYQDFIEHKTYCCPSTNYIISSCITLENGTQSGL